MQNVLAPDALKSSQTSLSVLAHSIGGEGAGGDYAFKIGAGPYWQGRIAVPSMKTDDAADVRGFIHSLRGANGCFLLKVPTYPVPTAPALSSLNTLLWGGDALAWGGDALIWGTGTFSIGFPDPDDVPAAVPPSDFQTTLTDDVAANNVCIKIDTVSAPSLTGAIGPGVRLWIGNDLDTGQLVDVVAVEGGHVEFRPHLRNAYVAGTLVSVGAVYGRFRLTGEVPAVPMNGQYSLPFDITFCEFY